MIRYPLAWAFQKDSEFIDLFDYHLQKMKEIGTIDKYQCIIDDKVRRNKDASNMKEEHLALGYGNVAFPFLALATGLIMAMLQLGIEVVVRFCQEGSVGNVNQSNVEVSNSKEGRELIEEINELLFENHSKDINLLYKMRALALSDKDGH